MIIFVSQPLNNYIIGKGSPQTKFLVKVGNLAQGGGRWSDPIPTFFQNRPKLILSQYAGVPQSQPKNAK